jgi:phosphate transport system substrate-binding protein
MARRIRERKQEVRQLLKGKARWLLVGILSLTLLAALAGCGPKPAKQEGGTAQSDELSGSITISGSTALQPLVEEAASQFMAEHKNAQISVQGGGSGTGLSQVFQGAVNIGMSDIFAEEKEGIDASQLKDHKVAVIGFAAVVNPANPIDNLSKEDLIKVFTGKITNWKELGGPDEKIVIINRPKGSGTRTAFKAFALDGHEEAEGTTQESSGAVRQTVTQTKGAISYLAISYLDSSVKALKIDGVEPTEENITSGKYPVWSYEHMYTKGEPTGLTKAFLDYMLSDAVQKDLVRKGGYIPITEMKVERQAPVKK